MYFAVHSRTSQKNLGGDEVLPKFCYICPSHDFLVLHGYDKKLSFRPKIMVFPKKKRYLPKFDNYFLHLINVAALKFLILRKFFLSLPKKLVLSKIFSCHCPKNYDFAQILETWRGNCPRATLQVQL